MTARRIYTWAPNGTLHVRRFGKSPKVIRPLADELTKLLLDIRPDLGVPAMRAAVHAWAWAEAMGAIFRFELDELGLFDEDGEPRQNLLTWETRLARRAELARSRLGLDPASYAQVRRDMLDGDQGEATLQRLREQGAKTIAARQAELDAARPSIDDLTPDLTRTTETVEALREHQ